MAPFERILRRLRADPVGGLSTMPASELRTLLLHVFQARASARPLRDIVRQAQAQALCEPSPIDARALHALEGHALAALPEAYEAIDLAPVVPLGAQHHLGATPQDNVLSGTRAVELIGDPTVAMALRLAARGGEGRLGARTRAVRMQPLRSPGHTQHFALFALASGGWSVPAEVFETTALAEHLQILLDLLTRVQAAGGDWQGTEVRVSDLRVNRALAAQHGVDVAGTKWPEAQQAMSRAGIPESQVAARLDSLPPAQSKVLDHVAARVWPLLRAQFPAVSLRFDFARLRQATYYQGLAFHVRVDTLDGPIADGGFVDWGQRLLNHRKHRLLTSGIGLQLLAGSIRVG